MKKLILILQIFIFGTLVFTNSLLFQNKAYFFSNKWIDEKTLKDIGFKYVKNEKIFMVFNDDLFIGKDGTFTINFDVEYKNAYKIENNELYLNINFLKEYLNLSVIKEGNIYIYYDTLPLLKSVEFKDNNLTFFFSKEITKEFINLSVDNRDLTIELKPIKGNPVIIGNVSFQKNENSFLFFILNNRLKPVPIISFQKNIVKIVLNFTEEDRKTLKDGLEWERKIEVFNEKKYLVNYLHIDPKKVEILPIISSNGIGTREDLREMLKKNNCIAGINANYFDPSTNIPIDLVIKDGKLLSDKYGLRPVFIVTYSNEVFIKRINLEVNIYLDDLLFLVKGVNTNAKGEVLLYTDEYALKVPKDDDKNYFVISNNQIISKEYVEKVPKDSMVLLITKKYDKYLKNIEVGSKVNLTLNSDFPFPIKHAIGAGPLLIENGKKLIDSDEEKLRYGNGLALSKTSRTIIAITKEGKVDFIVIEGYNDSPGMNYDIATEFLLEKGYFYAMMLDGGGSSAMVIQDEVVNQDGTIQRGIPVGLGVK
ncbi:exopolysaccharide biosynthesis protein [Thermosipho japonicus]|uniref:Exopolysaccharide biosynthesis protein n=1 Tax=Thermosipho japonicus TaxID=90323 RepID=A0A841GTD1_9BACT|nr:phosphodiester glycosidase family protein [Thermosipho japonicus]MBB6063189.1 exopolysaccharide biosynthesis protein [Thermosipho japonicus]